jgi:hypothetical protein
MRNSASSIALSVHCQSLEEAEVAIMAIKAYRKGENVLSNAPTAPGPDPDKIRAERIEEALGKAPMNRPKEIVLQNLLATPPGDWLAFPDMQKAFVEEGLAQERAAAALRDISWQMGEFMPAEDVAGLQKKIEVMAERTRAGGVYQYRLTPAGRIAIRRLLGDHVEAAV